jgi:hypothetical protein
MVEKLAPLVVPEPPDGSVVRFAVGRSGRYRYVAVRRGASWETTATGDYTITQTMRWDDLYPHGHAFEIATAWSAIANPYDPRVFEHLAVVRFTIAGMYLAALCIWDDGERVGDWYTTITDQASGQLPFGSFADWSDIIRYGAHVQVATTWAQLL